MLVASDRSLSLLGAFPFLVSLVSRFDQLLPQCPDLPSMSVAYDGECIAESRGNVGHAGQRPIERDKDADCPLIVVLLWPSVALN